MSFTDVVVVAESSQSAADFELFFTLVDVVELAFNSSSSCRSSSAFSTRTSSRICCLRDRDLQH